MPEFPISSARILLVSQIQGGQLPSLSPLSGTPMVSYTTNCSTSSLIDGQTSRRSFRSLSPLTDCRLLYTHSATDRRRRHCTHTRSSCSSATVCVGLASSIYSLQLPRLPYELQTLLFYEYRHDRTAAILWVI